MSIFKKLGAFGAPLVIMGAGAMATTACDPEVCGPCGSVVNGDVGISGSAKLDGFFKAVSDLNGAVVTASGDFEASLAELEAAFGLEAEGDLKARVDALVAEIQAEVSANASGGLVVDIVPAQCSANVDVAVEAQANCEASADCEVSAECEGGEVSVECEGSCEGTCEGECSADATAMCEVDAGGVECEGTCEGSCELEAAATCEGKCFGDCSGECSARDGEGNCAGKCDGECTGTCELSAAAECSGTCTGSCTAEAPSGGCEGDAELKCEGTCEGSCSGGCEGTATPPECSAEGECEASADCQAQAEAQASANVECTPPQIEFGFAFTGDASAEASFRAKMGALRAEAPVMLQSFVKLKALFDGEVNGEVVFDPAPVVTVTQSFEAVVKEGAEGELFADVPAGKISCVIPAMEESISLLGDLSSEAQASIEAQASFAGALSGGFSG